MTHEKTVAEHYSHGGLLDAIQASIAELGKTIESVTIEDLAPVDEFHIGGHLATKSLLDQLSFSEGDRILDVGCGIGGASRFVASEFNSEVIGIDLTQEYVDVGNALCAWVGLDDRVVLHQGSAASMSFEDDGFDGAFMLHVGMNVEDKSNLFDDIYRVLRPGAAFAIYDVMRIAGGEISYPVPWATKEMISKLETPAYYSKVLNNSGFKVSTERVRREFAIEFFEQMQAKRGTSGGLPPIGLHLLMQESAPVKVQNMIDNIGRGVIAPVEIIAQKPR
jgi:ubiquinone/menaquinone biosynthesis C-methylase UbiE